MNTVEFMENYVKRNIIKEFSALMSLKGKSLRFAPSFSNPILTWADGSDYKKFCLCNAAYWDAKALHGETYNLSGIIYNTGKIIIEGYDVQAQ